MRVILCQDSKSVKLNLLTLRGFKGLVRVGSSLFQEDSVCIITVKPDILLALNPVILSRNSFALCFLSFRDSFSTKTFFFNELEEGKFVEM